MLTTISLKVHYKLVVGTIGIVIDTVISEKMHVQEQVSIV